VSADTIETREDRAAAMAERFKRETANHVMEIKHDDGLYRHLRFMQPDSSLYWFELVTWPGKLAITGDLDGYMFSRTEDMFDFFRQSSWKGGINPTYWEEKVVAGSDGLMTYDEDLLKQQVADDLKDAEEHYPGVTEAWSEKVTGFFAEYFTSTEHDARNALNDFEYLPEGETGEPFRFQDTWEWQLKDYDWSFLWACHAIVWGISQYDERAAAPKTPSAALLAVADLFELRGLHKGNHVPGDAVDLATCPLCIIAAINVVHGREPDAELDGDAERTARALSDWLGKDPEADLVGLLGDDWNDRPEQTKANVVAVCRKAAAELAGAGQ
jgi:hypothetical protein